VVAACDVSIVIRYVIRDCERRRLMTQITSPHPWSGRWETEWRQLKIVGNLLIKLWFSMLSRLCSRLSLRVTVVRLDTCFTYINRGRRGFTNPAEHKSYILTYARQNSEQYGQARFCSYNSTIIGLVFRLAANIYSVGGARLSLFFKRWVYYNGAIIHLCQ
jgi:hypothetical protein